jgi:hypothetical protein
MRDGCTTCGGTPPESGLACICGGVGTIYAEVDGLRHHALSLERQLAEAQRERDIFRDRLIEAANEEPPTGWLRPGEDGYENTPQGARDMRDTAQRQLAAAERVIEACARYDKRPDAPARVYLASRKGGA